MKTLWTLCFMLIVHLASAQYTISGRVLADKEPLVAVNVYIDGTYDGGITDDTGMFSFVTDATGEVTLVASYLGFKDARVTKDVARLQNLEIKLKKDVNTLEAVTISANTATTGKNVKYASLKPLDIVTTAGANGDIMAALKTLPGTRQDDTDGRLFVKGGDADETAIYIDGLRVFSPYNRSFQGTPTRGRYSPTLFKGVNFSSSAYATSFGDALSGVLDMRTKDLAPETTTNINLMSLGTQLGRTQKWGNQSFAVNASYINLWLYDKLQDSRLDMPKPYEGFSGEAMYRYKFNKGILKTYVSGERGIFAARPKNIDTQRQEDVSVTTENLYSNTSYTYDINSKNRLFIGGSIGRNRDQVVVDSFPLDTRLTGIHVRGDMQTTLADEIILSYGVDHLNEEVRFQRGKARDFYSKDVNLTTSSAYGNLKYYLSSKFVVSGGLRTAYHHRSKSIRYMPRLVVAHSLDKSSQLTLSYGQYSQHQEAKYVLVDSSLDVRKSQHISLNYNLKRGKHLFRAELYHKSYHDLIRYGDAGLGTSGDGEAYGAELYWRGNNVVKNLDYYVSYSLVQGKRKYKDYPEYAVPSFNASHTFSVVGKYWIDDWKSLVSLTASVSSGRPYENPNTSGFLNEVSPAYKNLSMSWAYLISPQQILYFSASNFLGFKNEYGYRYARTPDTNGIYRGEKIVPNNRRFFFLGYFLTISADKKKNQLGDL